MTTVLSLSGVSLTGFNAIVVADVLAGLMGVPPASVTAVVDTFELSSTLSLAGSMTSLGADQAAAIANTLAPLLFVPPDAVHVLVASSGSAWRRLLQLAPSALQLTITVTNMGDDVEYIAFGASMLTDAITLASVVTNIASLAVTGASATPVVFSIRLLVVVQVPRIATPARLRSVKFSSLRYDT